MTDLTLMERAAKAADIAVRRGTGWQSDMLFIGDGAPNGWVTGREWNPLTDDGDALRLVVKCNLNVCVGYGSVSACLQDDGSFHRVEEIKDDPYAATRRAIVRAAAEIGRNMK